jgi:MFS family permease
VLLPGEASWLLVAATIGFDFGVQATLVAHQTLVYSLEPAARSRLNAVLFTGMFIGMAAGAALGSLVLAQWGWMGVVALATVAAGASLAVRAAAAALAEPLRLPAGHPDAARMRRVRRAPRRLGAAEGAGRWEQSRPERSGKGLTKRAAWPTCSAFLTGEAGPSA